MQRPVLNYKWAASPEMHYPATSVLRSCFCNKHREIRKNGKTWREQRRTIEGIDTNNTQNLSTSMKIETLGRKEKMEEKTTLSSYRNQKQQRIQRVNQKRENAGTRENEKFETEAHGDNSGVGRNSTHRKQKHTKEWKCSKHQKMIKRKSKE